MRKLDTPLARRGRRDPRAVLGLRRQSRVDHARRAARDAAAAARQAAGDAAANTRDAVEAARQAAGDAAANTRDAVGAALDGAMRDLSAPPPSPPPATPPSAAPQAPAARRKRRAPLPIRAPWFLVKTTGRSIALIWRNGPLVLVGLAGAALAHLLDPQNGARRRAAAAERLSGVADRARSAAGHASVERAPGQPPDFTAAAPAPAPVDETANTFGGANGG